MRNCITIHRDWSRRYALRWRLVFILFMPLVLGASGEQDGARRSISGFYNLYLKLRPLGVPDAQTPGKLGAYLSSSLRQQLKNALAAEQRYAIQNHNAVPPLEESDLFSSLFEGASAFKMASCDMQEKLRACLVEFTHAKASEKTLSWHDRIYLIREPRGWMIDDVEYLGDWQFMHKRRLKTLLQDTIAEGNKK